MSERFSVLDMVTSDLSVLLPRLPGLDRSLILRSLAIVESSYGLFRGPRFEAHFVCRIRENAPECWKSWGEFGAMSWGDFQVMGVRAWELGFGYVCRSAIPSVLDDPVVGCYLAVRHLEDRGAFQRIGRDGLSGDDALRVIGRTYNGGNPDAEDTTVEYCDRLVTAYRGAAPAREDVS